MKFAGMVILSLSGLAAGLAKCSLIRKKIKICSDAIRLCDMLLSDFSFRRSPIIALVESIVKNSALGGLDFVCDKYFYSVKIPDTPLSEDENARLGEFLYSLGKSDLKSQTALVAAFREYANEVKNKYSVQYKSASKVYAAAGLSFGIVLSLVLV